MEQFGTLLTALLGSDRTGADLTVLLLGAAAAAALFTCRKEIVGAFVSWVAAKVKLAEQRAQACILLANSLSRIQDDQATCLVEVGELRRLLERQEVEVAP